MLRRSKKTLKRFADDVSDLSEPAVRHSERGPMRTTNSNASLESTVFGGESRITEQLETVDLVTSGFKVSLVTALTCYLGQEHCERTCFDKQLA